MLCPSHHITSVARLPESLSTPGLGQQQKVLCTSFHPSDPSTSSAPFFQTPWTLPECHRPSFKPTLNKQFCSYCYRSVYFNLSVLDRSWKVLQGSEGASSKHPRNWICNFEILLSLIMLTKGNLRTICYILLFCQTWQYIYLDLYLFLK
jgi:hypothetical protein